MMANLNLVLHRWLDKRLAEATRMNDANQFLLDAEKKGLPALDPSSSATLPETPQR